MFFTSHETLISRFKAGYEFLMISIPQHFASWGLRALCLPLIAKVLWLFPIALEGLHHAPRTSGILLGIFSCLLAGWVGIFWRRGTQLRQTQVAFPIAVVWLSFRAFFDALAALLLAIGLACCLLVFWGEPGAQEAVLNTSLGSHVSDSCSTLNALANWIFHSTLAALFYAAGLRFDDGLDRLKLPSRA
jgi:hypothetical protein